MSTKNINSSKINKAYKNLESTDLYKNIYSTDTGEMLKNLSKLSPTRKLFHKKQKSLANLVSSHKKPTEK